MIRDEKNVSCVLVCVKRFVPELWSDDQPLVHLTSEEIAKKCGEEARKEFFSRFTRVKSLVTTKSTYYNSISKQPHTIFAPKKSAKTELVIPTDEGQSLAEILSEFIGKRLELKQVTHGRVTEKPWSIVIKNDKARGTAKSIFRNLLQQNSTVCPSNNVPADIEVSIFDAMRVLKMVPVKKLKPGTFRRWANNIFKYMKGLPGHTLHIVFDNYTYEYSVPTKDQSTGAPRIIANIDRELPNESECVNFLGNSNYKSQLIDLLVKYLLEEYHMGKDVNNRHTTY